MPNLIQLHQPAPDFSLPDYQGGTVQLSALRGKHVVLVFNRGFT
jgi:peroxiredoxin